MSTATTNHVAYTAPINPPNTTPILTRAQIWSLLERKIVAAQEFTGGVLKSTDVIETYTDNESGCPVTVRDVLFSDPARGKVREIVTAHHPTKVTFLQPHTGSFVVNCISTGAGGEEDLFMTYIFEWRHPGASQEQMQSFRAKEEIMAKTSVESTIEAMRGMVGDGTKVNGGIAGRNGAGGLV